jgi:GGDEF domain-containing protein
MNIISQQVGIAMENAILYQKMHELATTDSLTKIYNRLHFQERLSEELEIARKK